MGREAARLLSVPAGELLVEYFGLNHLGWVRSIIHQGRDRLPELLAMVAAHRGEPLPGLPFEPEFIRLLGLLPNEYNYFYTNTAQAVGNLVKAGLSRAGQIMPLNVELYERLDHLRQEPNPAAPMKAAYLDYLARRETSYMSIETGHPHVVEQDGDDPLAASAEGYAGVALGVIAALGRPAGGLSILNVPNRGAIEGMGDEDVVEVTCAVGSGAIRPLAVGRVPGHALGLMQRVKDYERLTVRAAVEGSYDLALKALALHPLVPSTAIARSILDDYIHQHGAYFPTLS
jgi:alpha-galactosidase/6-phospho-beta-glucosidase family protein